MWYCCSGLRHNAVIPLKNMKRYRVHSIDFDTTSNVLETDIKKEWEYKVKVLHHKNRLNILNQLSSEFGEVGLETKITNFIDFGEIPFSVIAYHNKFLKQIRVAFVLSAYYPALTATCTLGERILNYLIIGLRNSFKSSSEYKKIRTKDSFDNWLKVINILESWEIWDEGVKDQFFELYKIRNETIHFKAEIENIDRELSLTAINILKNIIKKQFSAFGNKRWFIPNNLTEVYIKKDYEKHPFIELVYIPNCQYVGYKHKLEFNGNWFDIKDDHKYEDIEITDEKFMELRNDQKEV